MLRIPVWCSSFLEYVLEASTLFFTTVFPKVIEKRMLVMQNFDEQTSSIMGDENIIMN